MGKKGYSIDISDSESDELEDIVLPSGDDDRYLSCMSSSLRKGNVGGGGMTGINGAVNDGRMARLILAKHHMKSIDKSTKIVKKINPHKIPHQRPHSVK